MSYVKEGDRIAVIGSGIAGMSTAAIIDAMGGNVSLFEKDNRMGGHTHTIDVGKSKCPVDTGFMVFNEVTYPNLVKLFHKLGVESYDTSMSFSVCLKNKNYEYNGSNLLGLFSQKKNLLNLRHLKNLYQIDRFNKQSLEVLDHERFNDMTLGDYVEFKKWGSDFLELFILPMSGAVWSCPDEKILNFPVRSLVRFFYNHGFMGLNTQHQWKTVVNGTRSYRDLLLKDLRSKNKILQNSQVVSVQQLDKQVSVTYLVDGQEESKIFDRVVLASHGDDSLRLLENPTSFQRHVLQNFKYQKNIATVHTDTSLLPRLRQNWSSWNAVADEKGRRYVCYYMNRLQRIEERLKGSGIENVMININGEDLVDPKFILDQITYHHPLFDLNAVKAQDQFEKINDPETSHVHFVGAYWRYGFHEDGLLSSLNLLKQLYQRDIFEEYLNLPQVSN